MTENQSIKDTLSVIRKALKDDNFKISDDVDENILVLNKLVKDDGTIDELEKSSLTKSETVNILNKKLDEIFEKNFNIWLDKNLPFYIDKYLKNKKI